MDELTADTIVLGAGAAGLAAAARLTQRGLSVLLLEARARIGGRIDTHYGRGWPVPLERGAEFIHGRPAETWDLLRAAGANAYDIGDTEWCARDGKLERCTDLWQQAAEPLARFDRVRDNDLSFEDFLRLHCAHVPPASQELAKAYVEGFNAADASQISVIALRAAEEFSDAIEGERSFRVLGGYGQVAQWLHTAIVPSRCRLLLNTVAHTVEWAPHAVRVSACTRFCGDRLVFTAPRLVVSLPLGVLQAKAGQRGAIRWDPPLEQKHSALEKLQMGPVVKVVLNFAEPFWETAGLDDLGFLHAPDEPLPTWWSTLPVRTGVLTGWSGGPHAARLSVQPRREVLLTALRSLAKVFGLSVCRLESLLRASQVCNWQRDPFSRGAYSYVRVGGADAPRQLGEPVDDTLFFAGEATHPQFSGTVSGAIQSGQRAADELLHAIGR